VDYHLKIGFTDIFIYDDHSTPPIEEQIRENEHVYVIRLAERIKIHPYYGGGGNGYREIFQKIKDLGLDYDYILDIDTDEYMYLDESQTIQEMIRKYLPLDILLLNFLYVGNSGLIKRDTDGVLNHFNMSNDHLQDWGKSLVNFHSIEKAKWNPHIFQYFEKPGNALICKNVNHQLCVNWQPVEGTDQINSQIVIEDGEMKKVLPCVFHYCIQDIESFVDSKGNNQLIMENDDKKSDRIRIGFDNKELKVDYAKIQSEQDFLDYLKENGYKETLNYYNRFCENKVKNELLYRKFFF